MSEQLFCIFAAAVGALVFGLVLAKVSETFQHMNPTKDEILKNADSSKANPPLYGALLKNEQDVQLLERLAFMSRREQTK